MTTYHTRGLEGHWKDVVTKVRAHGGEVTRFLNLLSEDATCRIYADKEFHRAAPLHLVMKYGYTGENTSVVTGKDWNGADYTLPALIFEDFNKMMQMMGEDVHHSHISYCLYDQKILTHADVMDAWSSEAISWATNYASMYYNILVGSFPFGWVDDYKKLPKNVFKKTSTAPRTFEDAFPNISYHNQTMKKEQVSRALDFGDASTPMTPHHPQNDIYLDRDLSINDLQRIIATLGDSKIMMYNKAEKRRLKKKKIFENMKLGDFTTRDIDEVINRQRHEQIKELLFGG